jgi:hypothetical protein
MEKEDKDTKNIGKEIKSEIQKIKGVKLSVKTDYNSINVHLMEAPFEVFTDKFDINMHRRKNLQVNHYYFKEDKNLTKEVKTLFSLIDEIIKKYYWDKSEPMVDYFNCAFYYHYEIGKWDKDFIKTNK